jgi:ribosomal protein S18 acetylase RimI-like enzyme
MRALERAQVSMIRTMAVFADHAPSGFSETIGGATALVTGLPHPIFNSVYPTDGATRDDMQLASAAVAEAGFPWCVVLREGRDDEHLPWVASMALTADDETVPLMAAVDPNPAAWPEELELVRGAWTIAMHRALVCDAFDLPEDLVNPLVTDDLAEDPAVDTVVGILDGLPVTTAMGVRVDDAVGIFSVATIADVRGRGYGSAVTWAAMQPAVADGATMAVLQTSPLGHSVYEGLGYEVVAIHKRWIAHPD